MWLGRGLYVWTKSKWALSWTIKFLTTWESPSEATLKFWLIICHKKLSKNWGSYFEQLPSDEKNDGFSQSISLEENSTKILCKTKAITSQLTEQLILLNIIISVRYKCVEFLRCWFLNFYDAIQICRILVMKETNLEQINCNALFLTLFVSCDVSFALLVAIIVKIGKSVSRLTK